MPNMARIWVIWPLVTIVQQKEYVSILAHGYLLSDNRIYDHFRAPLG